MWNRLPLIMLITCLYHAFHVKEILLSKFGMTVYANNRHLCGYIFVICNFICFFIRFRVSSLSVKVLIGIFFWSLKFPLTADKRSHVICKWVLFWSLDSLICLSSIVPRSTILFRFIHCKDRENTQKIQCYKVYRNHRWCVNHYNQ